MKERVVMSWSGVPWEGAAPIEAGRVMPHDVSLIATIAVGFALAFVLGFIAHRLRLPPLVGYLMGGVAMSRSSVPLVRSRRNETAESKKMKKNAKNAMSTGAR